MKKLLKFILYSVAILLLIYLVLFSRYYYKRHYKYIIDEQYAIVDYYNGGEGFYLIDKSKKMPEDSVVIKPPIVWYCVSKKYIMGCIGEDIFDKEESYIPTCLRDKYFIVDKYKAENIGLFNEEQFNNFIQNHNVTCKKEYI